MNPAVYEQDFAQWAFDQAELMRSGRFSSLDLGNLIEEIECMGRSEYRALSSRMTVLVGHLLKWRFQPAYRGNSWRRTIKVQRRDILRLLKESPSLKTRLGDEQWLGEIWQDAVGDAAEETGIDETRFPGKPIWTAADMLNPDFFPEG